MNSTDIVLRFVQLFDQLGIPYMLVGSFSSNIYGRPRSTHGADFVVQLPGDKLAALSGKLGPDFQLDRQMSFETVTAMMRHIVQHPATAFKVELFLLSEDPHDLARFSRRQRVEFEGIAVWFPTPEDVIVTKLRWSKSGKRSKDTQDVLQVLAVQGASLDFDYIRRWCDVHSTRSLFEQLLLESKRFEQETP